MDTYYELFCAAEVMEEDETSRNMIITGAKDPDADDPTKEAFSSDGYFNPTSMAGLSEEVKAQLDSTDISQKKFTLKIRKLKNGPRWAGHKEKKDGFICESSLKLKK